MLQSWGRPELDTNERLNCTETHMPGRGAQGEIVGAGTPPGSQDEQLNEPSFWGCCSPPPELSHTKKGNRKGHSKERSLFLSMISNLWMHAFSLNAYLLWIS